MTRSRARTTPVHRFRSLLHRFDPESMAARQAALQDAAAAALPDGAALVAYYDALLFTAAHPVHARMLRLAEAELRRIARALKAQRGRHDAALAGQGLPWVDTITRFTHDCVRWLLAHPHCQVALDSYGTPTLELNAVLRLTLPTLERNETTASLDNDALLDALRVAPADRLTFLVRELARLDAQPYVKDQLFDALDAYVRVRPTDVAFSKAWNRLDMGGGVFFQTGLLRQFDPIALMNQPLPTPRPLDEAQRADAIRVLKNTMALTSRETDPATYLDAASLRVVDLERGLTVAIFGMTPERQLPLEAYLGFTLFKNGFPVAYGGAWVMGERAAFGMNIFEPFRGGESGYMMCQVLRAYRQTFGVRWFEVDAHQFGRDNPDGIASGAYWFYWRHGFRSLDPQLQALAERERRRMAREPAHRSSEKTLLRLTDSNVALDFGGGRPTHLFDVTLRVTELVATRYGGDRQRAEAECTRQLRAATPIGPRLTAAEQRVLAEVALIARALDVQDAVALRLLARMVRTKPRDALAYQKLLQAFLARVPVSARV